VSPQITFEYGTREAMAVIAARMREADRVELSVTSPGKSPLQVLMEALEHSRWCTVVRVDGEPAIAYGVAPSEVPHVGAPWMLATPDLLRIRRFFLQHCRGEVRLMEQAFPALFNRVHRGNTCAIRWLEFCGFTLEYGRMRGDMIDFHKGTFRYV
jgi:hypothetical protein